MSGGLHGVGVSVVNALSEFLDLTIWRDGKEHYMRFAHGDTVAPLKMVGEAPAARKAPRSPSCLPATFRSPSSISRSWSIAIVNSRSSIAAYGCSSSMRGTEKKEIELFYEGGIAAFVQWLDRNKTALIPSPIAVTGQRDNIGIDVALGGTTVTTKRPLLHNNIPSRDGG